MFASLKDREPAVCVIDNAGSKITGNAPLLDVEVERSSKPLRVQCRTESGRTATAEAVSRMRSASGSIIAGSAGMVIDHLTGKLYDYPRSIELVLGRSRTFDTDSLAGLPVQDVALAAPPAAVSAMAAIAPAVGGQQ